MICRICFLYILSDLYHFISANLRKKDRSTKLIELNIVNYFVSTHTISCRRNVCDNKNKRMRKRENK